MPEQDPTQSIGLRIRTSTLERLRDAASATGVTVTSLVERGATELLDRLEKERGQKFPARTEELRPTGRPPKNKDEDEK